MDFEALKEQMRSGEMPSFLVENKQRKERWAHLTEGVNDYQRLVLETLLDNAQKWVLSETSDTSNIQMFTTYGFPLIRRVFPNLIANELVSVQPISMPTAMIFYLDFEYGNTRFGVNAGDAIGEYEVDPITGEHTYTFSPMYSGGMVRGLRIGTGDGAEVNFVVANLAGSQFLLPTLAGSATVYVDGEPVAFTENDAATGDYTLDAAPAPGAVVTVDYATATPTEGGDNIPEIDFNMRSAAVTAETKKLKARWTLESQQDLMAYHGVNAETELLAVLGDEIRREIDRTIINDLLRSATGGNVTWSSQIAPGFNGSEREWRMTLYDAIIDANNLIYKKRYRNASWIVADPDTCARLEKLDGFTEVKQEWAGGAGMGVERFGILRNRFQVYKDPWFPSNRMLLGHRGPNMFETGYIYAPYVPLYTTPVFMDPNDMVPRRSVMSRYACKPVITDLYATVQII